MDDSQPTLPNPAEGTRARDPDPPPRNFRESISRARKIRAAAIVLMGQRLRPSVIAEELAATYGIRHVLANRYCVAAITKVARDQSREPLAVTRARILANYHDLYEEGRKAGDRKEARLALAAAAVVSGCVGPSLRDELTPERVVAGSPPQLPPATTEPIDSVAERLRAARKAGDL